VSNQPDALAKSIGLKTLADASGWYRSDAVIVDATQPFRARLAANPHPKAVLSAKARRVKRRTINPDHALTQDGRSMNAVLVVCAPYAAKNNS
jgi:hypothetical protein